MCAEVCVHESENWQFFCCSCCILSGVQFLNCITIGIYIFEFSQDHVTKNQPVAVPV